VAVLQNVGCKKAVEAANEEAVVGAITDGIWTVTSFKQSSVDITNNFTGWEFQYLTNGTSLANKTGTSTVNGTWSGNSSNFTFTANFNSTPPTPLEKLAGTWTVTRAVSTNKASYAKTENSIFYEMDLTKK
jgi:hypothetical protein